MALITLGVFLHFHCAAALVADITKGNRKHDENRTEFQSVQASRRSARLRSALHYDADLLANDLNDVVLEYDHPVNKSLLAGKAKLCSIISSPWFYGWIIGLFATWGALASLFNIVPVFEEKPFFAAHQVIVLVVSAFLASYGTCMWLFDSKFDVAFKQDKIYGAYGPAATLATVMFVFQIWDWFTTLVMSTEVEGQAQHVLHHIATAAVCAIGLLNGDHGFLLLYGPFFLGLSEASSVPLALMDLFRHNEEIAEMLPTLCAVVRTTFVALFLTIRCCYWPLVAADFCATTLAASSPLSLWMKTVVNVFNLGLLSVQLYWGKQIVQAERKRLTWASKT